MEFFGREQELEEFRSAFASERFEALLVYGRRRVGKTELIRKAVGHADDALVISCECKHASAGTNLRLISAKVAVALGFPADYVFVSFDALLEQVFLAAADKKVIFVIDEFSFLLKEDPATDPALSIAIDAHRHHSHLKLVLCGSYVDLMAGLVDAASPLYGRFTRIMKLQPFDYYTASLFYPNYSPSDKLLMYAALGGIPYFNSLADADAPALQNILDLVIRKDSILEHEVSEMLLAETNKVAGFNTVIELLGGGITRYSKIASRLAQDGQARPAYILSRLVDMGVLRKIEPINAKGNAKRTFYAFADNLIHFYYRYVFRYISERNTMTSADFFNEFIRDDLEGVYLPLKFEEVSAEAIARLSRLHRIKPTVYEVGTYSFDDVKSKINRRFDVVTRDRNGYVSYECKFTNTPIGRHVVEEEERQVHDLDVEFYRLGFVSKSGFCDDIDRQRYTLLTLEELYA